MQEGGATVSKQAKHVGVFDAIEYIRNVRAQLEALLFEIKGNVVEVEQEKVSKMPQPIEKTLSNLLNKAGPELGTIGDEMVQVINDIRAELF